MYVRWVVRKHKNADTANVTFHDAYLVESYRDGDNTPRQRTICYLGNIRQIDHEFPTIERELFLLRAERILASTPAVPADERASIIDMLRAKVPALTEAEAIEAFRNNMRWYYQWLRSRGGNPSRDELLRMLESFDERIGPL
ncbi:hypothetical protein SE17_32475 [Kouleothrix aurantiaca]|jgi:hypothetical protein|uniref:Uncharacterized protein n=1 Tax=Kouleothrix aurantiaca TaxID=186479 RepID=A0A0P9DA74_9CHLR|nr:hypothetical protein SE17_32475 [Kouleothrix aurantiaca]